jgi:hypothetical protein
MPAPPYISGQLGTAQLGAAQLGQFKAASSGSIVLNASNQGPVEIQVTALVAGAALTTPGLAGGAVGVGYRWFEPDWAALKIVTGQELD